MIKWQDALSCFERKWDSHALPRPTSSARTPKSLWLDWTGNFLPWPLNQAACRKRGLLKNSLINPDEWDEGQEKCVCEIGMNGQNLQFRPLSLTATHHPSAIRYFEGSLSWPSRHPSWWALCPDQSPDSLKHFSTERGGEKIAIDSGVFFLCVCAVIISDEDKRPSSSTWQKDPLMFEWKEDEKEKRLQPFHV